MMKFLHKEIVYYYYSDDYDSHMLPPPSPSEWIMTKVLPRNNMLLRVLSEREGDQKKKKNTPHNTHWKFFFLYFVSFRSCEIFFCVLHTRLRGKEERTFLGGAHVCMCRWQRIPFALQCASFTCFSFASSTRPHFAGSVTSRQWIVAN